MTIMLFLLFFVRKIMFLFLVLVLALVLVLDLVEKYNVLVLAEFDV